MKKYEENASGTGVFSIDLEGLMMPLTSFKIPSLFAWDSHLVMYVRPCSMVDIQLLSENTSIVTKH